MPLVIVSDNVHLEIVKKQTELLEKGIKKRMQDITDEAIIKGLPLVKIQEEIKKKISCIKDEIDRLITNINNDEEFIKDATAVVNKSKELQNYDTNSSELQGLIDISRESIKKKKEKIEILQKDIKIQEHKLSQYEN